MKRFRANPEIDFWLLDLFRDAVAKEDKNTD